MSVELRRIRELRMVRQLPIYLANYRLRVEL